MERLPHPFEFIWRSSAIPEEQKVADFADETTIPSPPSSQPARQGSKEKYLGTMPLCPKNTVAPNSV